MHTKEALDRQTQELQEHTWIYMLHNQAPPPTPMDARGFIPLAPLSSHTHAASPLVAARAAAASLALQGTTNWASAQPSPSTARPLEGMVKLEKKPKTSPSSVGSGSGSPSFVFRSIISKSAVPEAPTPSAHVQRSTGSVKGLNGLLELLPKRPREDDVEQCESYQQDNDNDDDDLDETKPGNGKRACLPKKCDFPMCKNSSRSRGFCYSHGGGRRCRIDGCANGAVSRDLCKRHGGGRRCRIAGCKSSSESGGLCYSHGGGRRCNLSWCNARAKKGGYCAAHVDNRNALPPVDVVENERGDAEQDTETATSSKTIPASAVDAVNPQVIETLLSLSKPQSDAVDTTSAPSKNPYAIASILN